MINSAESRDSSWLRNLEGDDADERAYGEDLARVIAAQTIAQAMEVSGVSRSTLAERLGCHKSFVTRVLSGPQNVTLSTLGSFLWAAGFEVAGIDVTPMGTHGYFVAATTHEALTPSGIVQGGLEWCSPVTTRPSHDAILASHNLALAA